LPATPALEPPETRQAEIPQPAPQIKPSASAQYVEMSQELKRMRSLLESQLSGFAWGELARRDPIKAELMRTLLGAGFSPQLARQLVDAMPKGVDHEKGLKWLKAALAHNLRVVESGADFITRGGVYALVGPTGVGKTTTVAKLAARAVLKFGAERVALITTDSYRIGAHEQLKIYGRILNVPVHAVKDETELQLTLADLTRSHLILIDTVGMSQRDRRITEQIEFLCGRGSRVRRHLLLPATAQNVTLDDIVRAYKGSGMDGVILSKIDESVSIAPAIDCLIRHGLDLHYVTNGQKVPEDLHLANALYLVDRAFKGQENAASLQAPFEQMITFD
jgi:flagellar biosynthesis protein FlhF